MTEDNGGHLLLGLAKRRHMTDHATQEKRGEWKVKREEAGKKGDGSTLYVGGEGYTCSYGRRNRNERAEEKDHRFPMRLLSLPVKLQVASVSSSSLLN